jgi:ribonuclease HI
MVYGRCILMEHIQKKEWELGVVLISPTKQEIPLSYKIEFEATNNVVEYEALILGLEAARKMQITKMEVFGDSELVVQ